MKSEVVVPEKVIDVEAEADKLSAEKKKEILLKDYNKILERLKSIPEEILKLKQNKYYVEKDLNIKIKLCDLRAKDYRIRMDNFEPIENKANFKWEITQEWLDTQKEMLQNEINSLEFQKEMHTKSLEANNDAIDKTIKDVEEQRKRCIEAHKVDIKNLKEECEVTADFIAQLKKSCPFECCR